MSRDKHGVAPYLVPGLDQTWGEDPAQDHTVLLTTKLAHAIADVMEQAHQLIEQHRGRMLDWPDQVELDCLVGQLESYACGLALDAARSDAEPPFRLQVVRVAPALGPPSPY